MTCFSVMPKSESDAPVTRIESEETERDSAKSDIVVADVVVYSCSGLLRSYVARRTQITGAGVVKSRRQLEGIELRSVIDVSQSGEPDDEREKEDRLSHNP